MNVVNQHNNQKPSLIFIMHQNPTNFIFIGIVAAIGFQKKKLNVQNKTEN